MSGQTSMVSEGACEREIAPRPRGNASAREAASGASTRAKSKTTVAAPQETLKIATVKQVSGERDYIAIEGFSGPGGLSLGLHDAGFKLACAFDFDEWAVATHNLNLGNRAFVADAVHLSAQDLLDRAGLREGELDLFAGGPPCQGFSKQKRGAHLGDERNDLVREFIRLVRELRPRFFIFENVAIFGQKRGREYLREMIATLSAYRIYPKLYNSANYGLPQTRERFIAVGRRADVRTEFAPPRPTVKKWRTVGDVLNGLPEPPTDYCDHPQYPNHRRARVTPINIERFSYVRQGGGWKDIPEHLRLECHKNIDPTAGGWPDVYGRLEWDGQCPTITGGFDSFTRGRYGHPLHNRPLTSREAARIQGFPDSFVFLGTRADIRSQIGNAVPPPLGRAIGAEILRSLRAAEWVGPGGRGSEVAPRAMEEQ